MIISYILYYNKISRITLEILMHRTHVYSSVFKSLLIALIVIQIIHTYIQIVANSIRMLFMYSEYDEKKERNINIGLFYI